LHSFYNEFLTYLNRQDKEHCVSSVLGKLSDGEIDIVTLYEEILTLSLREQFCRESGTEICIWEEHVRTSIIRTVIECCYPYLIGERDRLYNPGKKGPVIVTCPSEEYHEIGARMVADFFTLCGYDVTFVGANTPREEVFSAFTFIKPVFVAISVTNYYNLVAARKMINRLREIRTEIKGDFRIIVGGIAFQDNPSSAGEMGADRLLVTFSDIKALSEED
jgi:MerR family transcriptional regulator, light-induced transcriptional regulator